MTACRLRNPSCPHLQFVKEYRDAREAAEAKRDAETLGYAAEATAYGPIVDFHQWLKDTTGWSGKHLEHLEQEGAA